MIKEFLENIAKDTRKYCFGLTDTVRCLEMGSVETIIVWEDFPIDRCVYKQQGKEYVFYLNTKT